MWRGRCSCKTRLHCKTTFGQSRAGISQPPSLFASQKYLIRSDGNLSSKFPDSINQSACAKKFSYFPDSPYRATKLFFLSRSRFRSVGFPFETLLFHQSFFRRLPWRSAGSSRLNIKKKSSFPPPPPPNFHRSRASVDLIVFIVEHHENQEKWECGPQLRLRKLLFSVYLSI